MPSWGWCLRSLEKGPQGAGTQNFRPLRSGEPHPGNVERTRLESMVTGTNYGFQGSKTAGNSKDI